MPKVLSLFKRNRPALFGAFLLGFFLVFAVLGPLIYHVSPFAVKLSNSLAPPSPGEPFGADLLGRDLLARSMLGGEISLYISVISVVASMAVGIPLGLIAGYFKGWTDEVIMRVMDIILAFPSLVLALLIVASLGIGINDAILAIGFTGIPAFARLVRGVVLQIKELDYVEAARALGFGNFRIISRQVLPNVVSVIIVQTTLSLGGAILTEAALSFLGLGAPAPLQSLGGLVNEGFPFLERAWWYTVLPGALITVGILGSNLLGDGLRDLLDPRLKGLR